MVFYKLRIIGNYADGSAICCIIGGRHRTVLTEGRNRKQLADNYRADHPDFTVCNNIIRYVYRADLILGRSLTFRIRIPVNAHRHGFCQRENAHGHGFCPTDVVVMAIPPSVASRVATCAIVSPRSILLAVLTAAIP